MKRADYQDSQERFLSASVDEIIGSLVANSFFAVDLKQRNSWLSVIAHLKTAVANLEGSYIFPGVHHTSHGSPADAVVLVESCVFVLEYKVGSERYYPADIDQVVGYALDLKNFHEPSHGLTIFPILIANHAEWRAPRLQVSQDGMLPSWTDIQTGEHSSAW